MNYFGKPDPEDFKGHKPKPTKSMKLSNGVLLELSGADEYEKFSHLGPIQQKEIDKVTKGSLAFVNMAHLVHQLQK